MESKTKNRKTREQLAVMTAKTFNGLTLAPGEESVHELEEGWFNAAYDLRLSDGRNVILKIAPPEKADILTYEQNLMATEVAAMRLVAENPAIPVPEIYFYDSAHDVCYSDYFFMEKLQGENFEHVKESLAPEIRSGIEHKIGEIVREINQFTGDYFGYPGNPDLRGSTWRGAFLKIVDSLLTDGVRLNADYGFTISDIRETIEKHAPSLEEVTLPRLVHWDAWDSNFFVQDGQVTGIIDFERALWGDPLMEAQFRALAFGGVSESMRGYGKTEFTAAEEIRCYLYTLHLALVVRTESYNREYNSDEIDGLASHLLHLSMTCLMDQ
jgi:aminoglycoside phosphotransferase (APT) family kinase protein